MPSFSFGIPMVAAAATVTNSSGIGISSADAGSTGSLFKLAGITPCSEPPTKASADSSTTDGREYRKGGRLENCIYLCKGGW
jgi:hypothetical protein